MSVSMQVAPLTQVDVSPLPIERFAEVLTPEQEEGLERTIARAQTLLSFSTPSGESGSARPPARACGTSSSRCAISASTSSCSRASRRERVCGLPARGPVADPDGLGLTRAYGRSTHKRGASE
jgi:hypothetical protein